jgi:hypothetical protein
MHPFGGMEVHRTSMNTQLTLGLEHETREYSDSRLRCSAAATGV